MRIIVFTVILAVSVILLGSGCRTGKVTLTEIPKYQKPATAYDTSAGCYVDCDVLQNYLKASPGNEAAIGELAYQIKNLFADALRGNKYKVVNIEGLSTKGLRSQIDKMIFLEVYNKRSLRIKKQTIFDVNIVVAVADVPKVKGEEHKPLRYFTSWGRYIVEPAKKMPKDKNKPQTKVKKKSKAELLNEHYMNAATQAINNLFCIDAFRKSLEPAAKVEKKE